MWFTFAEQTLTQQLFVLLISLRGFRSISLKHFYINMSMFSSKTWGVTSMLLSSITMSLPVKMLAGRFAEPLLKDEAVCKPRHSPLSVWHTIGRKWAKASHKELFLSEDGAAHHVSCGWVDNRTNSYLQCYESKIRKYEPLLSPKKGKI